MGKEEKEKAERKKERRGSEEGRKDEKSLALSPKGSKNSTRLVYKMSSKIKQEFQDRRPRRSILPTSLRKQENKKKKQQQRQTKK